MGNLQDVVVGIKSAVVDPFLFRHHIIIQSSGHLGILVVAGDLGLDVLQDGEEDSGLHQD